MQEEMREKLEELGRVKAHYISHLKELVRQRDWHGVMDAAADIREIEAKEDIVHEWRKVFP